MVIKTSLPVVTIFSSFLHTWQTVFLFFYLAGFASLSSCRIADSFNMRFSLTTMVAALAAIPHATATLKDVDEWDILAGKALANQVLYQFTKPRYTDSECTPFNAAVRREWYVLVQSCNVSQS